MYALKASGKSTYTLAFFDEGHGSMSDMLWRPSCAFYLSWYVLLEDGLAPTCSLWPLWSRGGVVRVGSFVRRFSVRMDGKCCEGFGDVRRGDTRGFVLPLDVPLVEILCNSPKLFDSGDGEGSVPRWLKRDKIVYRLKASSLEMTRCKQASSKSLVKVINKDEAFFSPFFTPFVKLWRLNGWGIKEEDNLMPQEACQLKAQIMLEIVAHSLLLVKLESRENIFVHIAHRVLWQFGYEQRMVQSIGDMSCSSVLVVENKFVDIRRLQILAGAKKLFCLGLEWCTSGSSTLSKVFEALGWVRAAQGRNSTRDIWYHPNQGQRPFLSRKKIEPMVNIEAVK